MGRAVFKANVVGADRMAKKLRVAASQLPRVVREDFDNAGGEIEGIFRDFAPYDYEERDDYHLQDNIVASLSGGGGIRLTVRAEAISPGNGFNYLDVTRFGRGAIVPKRRRWLKYTSYGRTIFSKYSGPWAPAGDWVEEGAAAVDPILDDLEEEIGRDIDRIIS